MLLRCLLLAAAASASGASFLRLRPPDETLAAVRAEGCGGGPRTHRGTAPHRIKTRPYSRRGAAAGPVKKWWKDRLQKALQQLLPEHWRRYKRGETPPRYEEAFSSEAELSRLHKLALYRAYMWNKLGALDSSCVVRLPKRLADGEVPEVLEHLPTSGAAVFVMDHAFKSSDTSSGSKLTRNDLDDPRILAMASEDWIGCSHPKLTRLPIGLDSQLMTLESEHDRLTHFLDLIENPKDFEARTHTLLSDAHLQSYPHPRSGSRDDRKDMIREMDRSVVDDWYTSEIPFTDHLDHVADAKFALCPEGNGLDTHRFYQNYALGTRCIVRDGPLSQLHAEFPGTVTVKSWRDVTAENLAKWSKEKPPPYDGRLLTAEYWIARVLQKATCGTELVPALSDA